MELCVEDYSRHPTDGAALSRTYTMHGSRMRPRVLALRQQRRQFWGGDGTHDEQQAQNC